MKSKNAVALTVLVTALTLPCVNCGAATAQQVSQLSPFGDWKLTAIYDKFEDGHLRSTWGDKPQGLLQLSAGGFISLQVMGGDRSPKSETVPTEPVGPVRCSYGTYILDMTDKMLRFVVQQDTYPQFIGVTLGPNPQGLRIFQSDGRMSNFVLRSDLPKFASNKPQEGTADHVSY